MSTGGECSSGAARTRATASPRERGSARAARATCWSETSMAAYSPVGVTGMWFVMPRPCSPDVPRAAVGLPGRAVRLRDEGEGRGPGLRRRDPVEGSREPAVLAAVDAVERVAVAVVAVDEPHVALEAIRPDAPGHAGAR